VTDEPDLDRLFTRLSAEGRRLPIPDDHPAPEKLSAYLANELSPEEDDALQEHLSACTLCTGLLLDLQRFLDPPEEDRPREGVADFETAAEWRELKGRMGKAETQFRAEKKSLLRKLSRARALAAVFALLFVGVASVVLKRELTRPSAVQVTTIEAPGGKKGAPEAAEPTPFRLGNVAMFDTHSERPYPSYRLSFVDKDGQTQATVEAQEDENGMIGLRLPKNSLPPGPYHVQVLGLEGAQTNLVQEFYIRILR
jgi:putative zinc finger protein